MTFLGFWVHLREDGCHANWTCINRYVCILLWIKVGSEVSAYNCFFQLADCVVLFFCPTPRLVLVGELAQKLCLGSVVRDKP